jgi:protein-disulfide isomerase
MRVKISRMMDIEQRSSLAVPVDERRDHVRGGAAPGAVTLVVYGDYECPYTRAAYRSTQQIEGRLGERMRFVFRHFPLRSIHPHAQMAAEAAEEAAAQSRYWEMHDVLFGHQDNLEPDDLRRYALELELHVDRFDAALSDGRHRARIQEDVDSGKLAGVSGTPTLFIEELLYSGSRMRADLERALLAARPAP